MDVTASRRPEAPQLRVGSSVRDVGTLTMTPVPCTQTAGVTFPVPLLWASGSGKGGREEACFCEHRRQTEHPWWARRHTARLGAGGSARKPSEEEETLAFCVR